VTALPPDWIELEPAEALVLETELRRELAPTHQLYGLDLRAVAISLVCWLIGILFSVSGPVGAVALSLAWLFWAVGGLLPFTIALLLRAGPRIHGEP
jgi:hypothetical protein